MSRPLTACGVGVSQIGTLPLRTQRQLLQPSRATNFAPRALPANAVASDEDAQAAGRARVELVLHATPLRWPCSLHMQPCSQAWRTMFMLTVGISLTGMRRLWQAQAPRVSAEKVACGSGLPSRPGSRAALERGAGARCRRSPRPGSAARARTPACPTASRGRIKLRRGCPAHSRLPSHCRPASSGCQPSRLGWSFPRELGMLCGQRPCSLQPTWWPACTRQARTAGRYSLPAPTACPGMGCAFRPTGRCKGGTQPPRSIQAASRCYVAPASRGIGPAQARPPGWLPGPRSRT